jgi:hypothetical protein
MEKCCCEGRSANRRWSSVAVLALFRVNWTPGRGGQKCSAEFRAVLNLSILQRHARVPEQRLRSFAWASNLLTVFIFSYDLMLFEVSRGVATLLEPTRRGSSPLPRIAEAAIFYAAHATQLPTCGSPASRVGPIGPSRPITHHGANEC